MASSRHVNPRTAHTSGGLLVELPGYFEYEGTVVAVYFGGVAAQEISTKYRDCGDDENPLPCYEIFQARCPAVMTPGKVDVLIVRERGQTELLAAEFNYLERPEIISVAPTVNSILPDDDDEIITLFALGASLEPGLQVLFETQPSRNVTVTHDDFSNPYIRITCLPPAFPEGSEVTIVDLTVVNPDGGEGSLSNAFRFGSIEPEILFKSSETLPAWRIGTGIYFYIEHMLLPERYTVYFNGAPGSEIQRISIQGFDYLYVRAPASPPQVADISIISADGGRYQEMGAVTYIGTPGTDFHPGDFDQDFRFNLSEVLRVVQFFNSGGMHCDPRSEDGYGAGIGDDISCPPYPSDNAPFNWNLGLSELLSIIQFYNLHCYQPCAGAPGTYCPPN